MFRCRAYWTRSGALSRTRHHRHPNVPISSSSFHSFRCSLHQSAPAFLSSPEPQTALRKYKSSLGCVRASSRYYATLTELPPSTSTVSAPPPMQRTKSSRPQVSVPIIEQEPREEVATAMPVSIHAYDDLFDIANRSGYTPPQDLQSFHDGEELLSNEKASAFIASRALSSQTSLRARLQAKSSSRKSKVASLLTKTASPRETIKSISQQSFDSFRLQHRKAQYRLDYNVDGRNAEIISPPQPHHQSLVSRYDWRLRTPWRTPDEVQRHAYGSKILFRKRADTDVALESAELDTYQTKYRRFIKLEREESERIALARLRQSSKREMNSFTTSFTGPVEHLGGLQALHGVNRRHFQRATDSAEQATEDDVLQAETQAEHEHTMDERQLFLFSRPDRQELPANTFHRGKMVFIWKCTYDNFLQEWIVPELQDASLTLEQLSAKAVRGYVHREWSNQIDINCEQFTPQPGETFRIDVGYDGTAFDRQEAALVKLAFDASEQRLANENSSKGPHITSRNTELSGTELRDLLLNHDDTEGSAANTVMESPVLMKDEFIASWARRYSRPNPLRLDGDPDLGLNGTQLRAVANAVHNNFTLIQGPPGTGKTATLVAALKLLKAHFQIAAPILVCAHTNNVVDMIVSKCAEEGLRPLRFGREHRIREDLRQYGCEEQIRTHPLQASLKHWSDEEDRLRDRKKEISDLLDGKKAVFADLGTESTGMSIEEQDELRAEHDNVELGIQQAHMTYIKTLRRVHADLIASCDVCLATCMSASSWEMGTADFPIVFVDEAGQCDEPTTLIPFMKGARHAVLIGDHKQLPSVCSSEEARSEGLNRSLFERFKRQACVPSIQLDVQYRMLPAISAFPNKQFYAGSIKDSDERQASAVVSSSQPVTFFHHTHPESRVGQSLFNHGEVDAVIQELLRIQSSRAHEGIENQSILSTVGVISMYAAQTEAIRMKARAALGEDHEVEIHTVDGFQGRDKHTILISTVRSNCQGNIGFLKDPRRLNVALTRARNQLLIFGNATTLAAPRWWEQGDSLFAQYIAWIKENGFLKAL